MQDWYEIGALDENKVNAAFKKATGEAPARFAALVAAGLLTQEEALSVARSVAGDGGRVVVKALVPAGRRGKAGAVKVCAADACGEIGVEIYKRQEELAAIRVDRRPDLPRIKCPTTVVCGRDDAATPLFLSEEIAKAIPAAALVVIEQCGHLVTMEKPEETNQILKLWLSR